jgi:hypothetical protein
LECSFSFCSNGTYLDISFFKQFSTQDFHIQLEPCGAQKDLEVLQQTRYVLWQPKKQREKEDKKRNLFKPKPLLLAKSMRHPIDYSCFTHFSFYHFAT